MIYNTNSASDKSIDGRYAQLRGGACARSSLSLSLSGQVCLEEFLGVSSFAQAQIIRS